MDPVNELQAKGRESIKRLIELGKRQPEPVQTWGLTAAAAAGGALVLSATTQGVLAVAATLAAPPVVLTVGVIGGGLAGWSYMKNRKAAVEQAAREGTPLPPLTSSLPSWLQQLPWLQRETVTQTVAPHFRAWVERDLGGEPLLQNWLLSLSPEQLQLLVKHLLTHCEQLSVELNWLLEDQPDMTAELKQAVHEIVVGYCTGIWKAVQMKPALDQLHTSGDQSPPPPPEVV